MVRLLYQLPFLDGTGHQTPYSMEVDTVHLLVFFVFAWYSRDEFFLREKLFDKFVDVMLEVLFLPTQRYF